MARLCRVSRAALAAGRVGVLGEGPGGVLGDGALVLSKGLLGGVVHLEVVVDSVILIHGGVGVCVCGEALVGCVVEGQSEDVESEEGEEVKEEKKKSNEKCGSGSFLAFFFVSKTLFGMEEQRMTADVGTNPASIRLNPHCPAYSIGSIPQSLVPLVPFSFFALPFCVPYFLVCCFVV